MVDSSNRVTGSADEFEDEWHRVLETDDLRYYVYPSKTSCRQADLLEWIKARQIISKLQHANLTAGRILEFGCGAAGISLYLADLGYEAHICDFSSEALRVARRNQHWHTPGVELTSSVAANALQLPYANNSFDVVMSFGLLEHFETEPLDRLLNDVIRVLKPGGLFIADIVPGLKRLNARTIGITASYVGSLGFHFLTGRWKRARELHRLYFEYYYENTHSDSQWASILRQHGLREVNVAVCRPFPPLALAGAAERLYTRLIRRFLAFHRRFDKTNNWFTRRWGWMYLASGFGPLAGDP